MNYATRITQLTVLPEGEPIFSEGATVIEIEAEVDCEYVSLLQSRDEGDQKILIDPIECPHIKAAVDKLLKTCRKGGE